MQKTARFYWAVGFTVLCGCAVARTAKRSEAKLALLKTGDSREQVIQKLGPPALSQSAPTGAVQYDQYRLFPKKLSRFVLFSGLPSATIAWWNTKIWEAEANVYWLKYADRKLEKWGPSAEFAAELSTSSPSAVTVSTAAVAASTVTLNAVAVSTPAAVVASTPTPTEVSSTTTPTQGPPSVSTSTH
jgi:hypothetical protein